MIRLVPKDELDLSRCHASDKNWLSKYQLRLPTAITCGEVSPLCRMYFHTSQIGAVEASSSDIEANDSVFVPAS